VLHFSFRSVAQIERKALHGGWLRNRDPRYEPTLHQILLGNAARGGRIQAYYDEHAIDDVALAAGLADGKFTVDTRVRDALRAIRDADRGFDVPAGEPRLVFPRPSVVDDAAYAAEASVLVEIDGIVRAEERVRALEERLLAIERGAGVNGAVRRLARR